MIALEVKNISKKFGKAEVIRNIGFSLEKGEVLSIIGSSGSGKTTLLRCLNFLETPDTGTIFVGGKKIFDAGSFRKPTEQEIRNNRLHFGLVFQSFNLFPQYTAIKNVTLAPTLLKKDTPEAIMCKAELLLEKVGLSARKDYYPCQLSGGQQQRVAIARALALDPEILCFDEPTSALDPELTGEVLKAIRSLKGENMTMIIVTHEMEFAREISDKVIFMDDGVICEQGTADEVFGDPKNERTRVFLNRSLSSENS